MPGYVNLNGTVGAGPLNELLGVADTNKRWPIGMYADALDPYFGYVQAVYLQFPVSTAVAVGRVMVITDQTGITADHPGTANLGASVVISMQQCASSATAQYGWFAINGIRPVQTNATVAQGAAIGIAAAGVLGTNGAGKQLLNCRVLQSATFTIAKANTQTFNGSPVVTVNTVDGLFVGLTMSGTGLSGTITAINPNGRDVTLSANCTATGIVTMTGTYTGYGLVQFNNAFTQGAIT